MSEMERINQDIAKENLDNADQIHDVFLANELLKSFVADKGGETQAPLTETVSLTQALTPLSKDDFKNILVAAQEIYDQNELKEFKERQARHNEVGKRLAGEIIAENDIVLPAAQLRILDVYKIPVDTFKLAQAATKLGESQNDNRTALAVRIGLPAHATREMIYAEKENVSACEGAKIQIDKIVSTLQTASEREEFRYDLVSKEGFLNHLPSDEVQDRKDVIELESNMASYRLPLALHIRADHLECSKNYPGLSWSETVYSLIRGLFAKDSSYGEKKLEEYSFSFQDAYAILEEKSPAFRSFLDRLPEGIEIIGSVITSNDITSRRIDLKGIYLKFKLKGYSEDAS
jgi:hypothetical protein